VKASVRLTLGSHNTNFELVVFNEIPGGKRAGCAGGIKVVKSREGENAFTLHGLGWRGWAMRGFGEVGGWTIGEGC
jgi:hypothetical protein